MDSMTWRDVFDTDKIPWSKVRLFSQAQDLVRETGYKYLSWNGQVYDVDGSITQPVCSINELIK